MKIHFCSATVKTLKAKRQSACKYHDGRLVRRISVLLAIGVHQLRVEDVAEEWGLSRACVYEWLSQCLAVGIESIYYHKGGGRKSRLSLQEKKQLCQWLDAGPHYCDYQTNCWSSLMIAELIENRFGIKYNRHYLIALLKGLGYSYQKGEFESSHLDPQKRQAWLEEVWPALLAQAQASGGLILFGDEVSFAQWGSLSYTWARKGQTPKIKTSGKRKGYKVFGAIDYFSGRMFYQGISGKFNTESYTLFLKEILETTTQLIYLVQDGARYHTSRAAQDFFEAHKERLKVYQLPAYSPDYNPIEYLWRKTKRRATHNAYFEQFEELVTAVDQALSHFENKPEDVLGLFGCYHKVAALAS
jgi:transposase